MPKPSPPETVSWICARLGMRPWLAYAASTTSASAGAGATSNRGGSSHASAYPSVPAPRKPASEHTSVGTANRKGSPCLCMRRPISVGRR
ncbi:MAG: hypothetical protein H6736_06745 [Alphaproteobacteria bacterium]|nr:hypothetical protein [Alphaproteobacteria bacterium]